MEHHLGVMRSAVGLQVAEHFVNGNMEGLRSLASSNPMDMLAEQPNNYLGAFSSYNLNEFEKGNWIYDKRAKVLIYLVENSLFFESSMENPARARFKIFPVYADKRIGDLQKRYIAGLKLAPLEPYKWLRPWE